MIKDAPKSAQDKRKQNKQNKLKQSLQGRESFTSMQVPCVNKILKKTMIIMTDLHS